MWNFTLSTYHSSFINHQLIFTKLSHLWWEFPGPPSKVVLPKVDQAGRNKLSKTRFLSRDLVNKSTNVHPINSQVEQEHGQQQKQEDQRQQKRPCEDVGEANSLSSPGDRGFSTETKERSNSFSQLREAGGIRGHAAIVIKLMESRLQRNGEHDQC